MNYYIVLTIVGIIASIIGLFIPDKWRNKKVLMFAFLFLTIFISGWISNLQNEIEKKNSIIERKNNVSRKAQELIDKKQMYFTYRGYIQACLSFLEANQDLYPDSYENGKKIELELKNELKENKYSTYEVDAASEISGINQGIAILNH